MHFPGIPEYWHIMAVSVLAHTALAKLIPRASKLAFPGVYGRLNPETKEAWCVSVMALIHSVIDSVFVLAFLNDPALNQDKMGGYQPQFEFMLSIAQGYYTWDMILCITNFDTYGFMYLIHAALGVFGILVATSRHLQFYAIPFLIPEVSSVFLHTRHLLKFSGLSHTLLYKANFLAFLVAFVFIRVGFENYHTFSLIGSIWRGETGKVYFPFAVYFAVLGVVLMILNFIWLKQILTITYYTLTKKSSNSTKTDKKKAKAS